ncbi:DNA damage-inducible protein I [Salmonella enterica subsp. enterica]|nr:DNA damage-inducible protein I [Salmonella enterica subsp. enterica]
MRIELVISRTKQLPEGAVPALEKELITRLQNQYENCNLTIRRGSQDGGHDGRRRPPGGAAAF